VPIVPCGTLNARNKRQVPVIIGVNSALVRVRQIMRVAEKQLRLQATVAQEQDQVGNAWIIREQMPT
jgi:hypothetical protein